MYSYFISYEPNSGASCLYVYVCVICVCVPYESAFIYSVLSSYRKTTRFDLMAFADCMSRADRFVTNIIF